MYPEFCRRLHIISENNYGGFLTPGSGIGFFPDLGSLTHIFDSCDNFLEKNIIVLSAGSNVFLYLFWNKINGHKKSKDNYFSPLLLLLLLYPGSLIQDTGWIKIRIRDKHPGSPTLALFKVYFCWKLSAFPATTLECTAYLKWSSRSQEYTDSNGE